MKKNLENFHEILSVCNRNSSNTLDNGRWLSLPAHIHPSALTQNRRSFGFDLVYSILDKNLQLIFDNDA